MPGILERRQNRADAIRDAQGLHGRKVKGRRDPEEADGYKTQTTAEEAKDIRAYTRRARRPGMRRAKGKRKHAHDIRDKTPET